jgi:hypothetical protein
MTGWAIWILPSAILLAIFGGGCKTVPQDVIDALTNAIPGAVSNAVPDGGSVPTTTTTTTTTTVPPVAGAYTITKVTASMIYWRGPRLGWPVKDGCIGEARLNGHKFDHFREMSGSDPLNGTSSRDWNNVHSKTITNADGSKTVIPAYGAFATLGEPANGAACTLTLHSYDGKQSVKVGDFQWVR